MTNSKLRWLWTQVRGTFWFCYGLVQIFTDFVTWQIAKALKEWSIKVKKFCHFRGWFSFIIKMIKKITYRRIQAELQYFWKLVIWQHRKPFLPMKPIHGIPITLLWTASCVHVSGQATRTEMEAVPCILPAPFRSEHNCNKLFLLYPKCTVVIKDAWIWIWDQFEAYV